MKLRDFLQFAYDNHNSQNVNITREFKENGNYYCIVVNLDNDSIYQNYYDFMVTLDTTLNTISSSFRSNLITIKNAELVLEWSFKFDKLLDGTAHNDMDNLIGEALSFCNNTDIIRELKLKKLLN